MFLSNLFLFTILSSLILINAERDHRAFKSQKDDYGHPWTDKQIIEMLLKRYRFPESSSNVSVSVLIEIEEINDFKDDKCHLTVLLIQKWVEETLRFKDIRESINPVRFRTLNYIWNPSLTVDNAISMTPIGKDLIRVFSSGLVEYNHRVKLTTKSKHNLKNFPFETRMCTIMFTNDDSRASWSKLLKITLPSLTEGISDWITISDETISNYHNLKLKIKRSINNWIFTYFIPTFALVLASYIPVWLNTEAQISRTAISVVSFFSVLLIVISRIQEIPKTPYLKAIDYWNIAVCVLSFLSFLQSSLTISHVNQKIKRSISSDDEEEKAWISATPYYSQISTQRRVNMVKCCDYIFRIVAPICFGVFIVIFLITYVLPFWNISI